MSALSLSWRPRLELGPALLLLAGFSAVGAVQGLARLANASEPAPPVLIWHLTGAFGAWVALPVVQVAVQNAEGSWARRVVVHGLGWAAFAAVHFAVMIALRVALHAEAAPSLRDQAVWEAQSDLVLYGALATLWTALRLREARADAELRAARLDGQLVAARLEALSAQLDPHFLFNALHTVGATMHEDLSRTERLLASLGELLRATLDDARPCWSLEAERAHAGRYIELLQARFGTRLQVRWSLPDGLHDARVPRFALQSLVENAVKHNQTRRGPLHLELTARRTDDGVVLCVEDDGAGFTTVMPEPGRRSGLTRLAETLRLLHGDRATLRCESGSLGGARVTLVLPEVTA